MASVIPFCVSGGFVTRPSPIWRTYGSALVDDVLA
jgi:hypothetical protein